MAGTRVPRDIDSPEQRKFLDDLDRRTRLSSLVNAVNDVAAAAAGVKIDGLYRNGSVLMIRVS